jgi:hypothetical protein
MSLRRILAVLTFMLLMPVAAWADKADVMDVKVQKETGGTFRFDVTVKSDDTGWDKYADKWDVVGPDGAVLGTRELLHPHENEQPFTRSLSGVAIPEKVTSVTVRAHDKVEGYGGKEMTVELAR